MPYRDAVMYGNPQKRATADVLKIRREGGCWLRELRQKAGLSQRELARLVDTDYYTFISQLENGRGRIPPERYSAFARALKIEPREFVKALMRYYDPITFEILFGIGPEGI